MGGDIHIYGCSICVHTFTQAWCGQGSMPLDGTDFMFAIQSEFVKTTRLQV